MESLARLLWFLRDWVLSTPQMLDARTVWGCVVACGGAGTRFLVRDPGSKKRLNANSGIEHKVSAFELCVFVRVFVR